MSKSKSRYYQNTKVKIEVDTYGDSFGPNVERDLDEVRGARIAKNNAIAQTLNLTEQPSNLKAFPDSYFDDFVGYWKLDTCEDWDSFTLIQFYREDVTGKPKAKFYDGTQNNIREVGANDKFTASNPISYVGFDIYVEVIGFRAIRFINNLHLSTDDLMSTMRIQDSDTNAGVCQVFTDWDGSADNAAYGSVENLSKFIRLPSRPEIQLNNSPSLVNWDDPVNIMKYVNDYNKFLGMPQKASVLKQKNYIGQSAAQKLLQTFLTTGVTRTAYVSNKNKAGMYIGVWKTKFPASRPITTIHTQDFHNMNAASTVTITGFKGAFSVLNGTFKVSAYPCTVSKSTPEPWQLAESRQHYIHINYDSSAIVDDYDPAKHGTAKIVAKHGPVTSTTEYRDFAAALFDFNVTVWGPGTHSRIRLWRWNVPIDRNNPNSPLDFNIVDTFANLKDGIAKGTVALLTNNFRTYTAKPSGIIYHNPYVLGQNVRFPAVNINDPFGLGRMEYKTNFDYDIDISNYLDQNNKYNLFFAITGPLLDNEPITKKIVNFGYKNNGSQAVFTTNPFGVFPPNLNDEYGTHSWFLFGAADNNDKETMKFQQYHNYPHGIIDKKYTGTKTVGYIRIGDCDSFDSPMLLMTTRSLAFGRADMPNNRIKSNYIAALACVIKNLNQFNPDRIILDIRNNGGGFAHIPTAIASVFGGNRRAGGSSIGFAGDDSRIPMQINGSGLQTGNGSLQQNCEANDLINVDQVAAVFPGGVFRGTTTNPKEVIILTNTGAASAGDMIPHYFIGSDPNTTVHNIGNNVTARIIGDIDGRLWSGVKSYDGVALDPLNYSLADGKDPRTCVYLACEAGLLSTDRLGTLVNEQKWTQPNVLLPSWYDTTVWQDLGLISPTVKYPFCNHVTCLPIFEDRSTWRDIHLEYAIKY